jgi:hypothetical protein
MQHLMERYPRLALNTLGTLGGRLQETQTRLREISTERVERRIAHALIRLAEQTGKRVAGGIRIDFAISRQDVAEMTGTTLHTVSRTLSSWEGQGIVEGGRQRITIREPAALIAIAEDRPTSAQRFRVFAPEQRRAEPPPPSSLEPADCLRQSFDRDVAMLGCHGLDKGVGSDRGANRWYAPGRLCQL